MTSHSLGLIEWQTALETSGEALRRVVDDLADTPGVALARIWLVQPGDMCASCRMRQQCRSQDYCLHLVASAGRSIDPEHPETWNRLDGAFHRFPLHSQKIGRIGATGEPLLVHHVTGHSSGLARPDWVAKEGIQTFFGHPLLIDGEVVGVLAVFSRSELGEREIRFLRHIADSAARNLVQSNTLTRWSEDFSRLESENRYLRQDLEAAALFGSLVSCGPASRKLVEQIRLAAEHSKPVLITGERGTGKELTARLIHQRSAHHTGPFVRIDAADLTAELLDSKAESGESLTFSRRPERELSRLELAAMGTLFIDGLERVPFDLQERLAAVLESTAFGRELPESGRPCFGARIIASTTVDLHQEVSAGRLRHDLFCAVSVTRVDVPPLRERREDLPLLASEILSNLGRRLHRPNLEIDSSEMDHLQRYSWPGNVRELQQALERATLRVRGEGVPVRNILTPEETDPESDLPADPVNGFVTEKELRQRDRANVLACLRRANWKVYGKGGAAELLGVKPTTLLYRMKVLRIRRPSR